MVLEKIEEIDAKAVEQLRKDEAVAESLEVVKEVRQELAEAYQVNQSQVATIEQLSAELHSFKVERENNVKTMEKLSKDLEVFKVEKKNMEQLAHTKRIEQLSENFSKLGQTKSVEQLSGMSLDVIEEFESITGMALAKKSEEQLDIATIPTQGMGSKKVEPVAKKQPEEFTMEKLCNVLSDAQNNASSDSKRILHM
jgi:predicted RNase H-like nuclease (RuvC/YqgF family)